jgi:hypothetical protein
MTCWVGKNNYWTCTSIAFFKHKTLNGSYPNCPHCRMETWLGKPVMNDIYPCKECGNLVRVIKNV